MQHRRHLVFDGVFDLTCSSHPVIVKEKIQADKDAAYDTLRREWSIAKINLKSKLNHEGSVYYKAEDPNSKYTEHEVCHLFVASTDKLPSPNFEFAYGFSLVLKDRLKTDYSLLIPNIAPWVPPLMKLL